MTVAAGDGGRGVPTASTGLPFPECITDWSEAGPIVRQEGLVPMEQVGRLARVRAHVEILTSALCKGDKGYVYRLRVWGGHENKNGSFRTVYVNARDPFGP